VHSLTRMSGLGGQIGSTMLDQNITGHDRCFEKRILKGAPAILIQGEHRFKRLAPMIRLLRTVCLVRDSHRIAAVIGDGSVVGTDSHSVTQQRSTRYLL
jgi:hypothetical protein